METELADGPVAAEEIKKAARNAGIGERTLWTAKESASARAGSKHWEVHRAMSLPGDSVDLLEKGSDEHRALNAPKKSGAGLSARRPYHLEGMAAR